MSRRRAIERRLTLPRLARVLVAAGVGVWGLVFGFQQVAESQTGTPSPLTSTSLIRAQANFPTQTNGIIRVVAMGSDDRYGPPSSAGGCDAIHIISVDTQTMKGSIINVPRDTYLQGHKITDICRAQGFPAGIAALSAYTGIPLQYYSVTNFHEFNLLIDAIGGINIHVYVPMFNPGDTGTHFNPGDYHMLGGDLLAFTRDRYNSPGGDFGRTTDQAQVIMQGLDAFRSPNKDLSYVLTLIKYGRQHLSFNVPLPQLIQWGMIAWQMKPSDFQSCTLEGQGQMINGADVELPVPSNNAIFAQVQKDATVPPNAQCFSAGTNQTANGIDWEIPSNLTTP
jgi:LCP family protein required for cell wall assembly